ncbi:MAG: ABC transporter ATP-binding protein [Candidatus Diapherotrites archaeon]
MQKPIIELKNVVKEFHSRIRPHSSMDVLFPKYRTNIAVNNIGLDVFEGEIFGLLGPNGAGKTTLIKLITGILSPTDGSILIEGSSVDSKKRDMGLMLGYEMIYYRITGYDNLKYFGRLYGVQKLEDRIVELNNLFGLKESLFDYVENYSIGMKSKLALARALIHNPKILFLDEPTLGLDPNISQKIREEIKNMKKTVILTTHYLDEAQELCDRIALMSEGKIIALERKENFGKIIELFSSLGEK